MADENHYQHGNTTNLHICIINIIFELWFLFHHKKMWSIPARIARWLKVGEKMCVEILEE